MIRGGHTGNQGRTVLGDRVLAIMIRHRRYLPENMKRRWGVSCLLISSLLILACPAERKNMHPINQRKKAQIQECRLRARLWTRIAYVACLVAKIAKLVLGWLRVMSRNWTCCHQFKKSLLLQTLLPDSLRFFTMLSLPGNK